MSNLAGETYRLAYPTLENRENPSYISYGRPHHEACAYHVTHTFNAKRAFLIASNSLTKNTDEVQKLQHALGDRLVGTWPGFSAHTPWDQVLAATAEAREKKADCVITIGGGSLTDGAKAILLFLANDVTTMEDLQALRDRDPRQGQLIERAPKDVPIKAPTIPLICIPTTLSGGEFTPNAGGTDPKTHRKFAVGHPFCAPRLVIDDPKLTVSTPEWVWLSTGVRAIDHCAEAFCRTVKEDAELDAALLDGFKEILPNLLITKKNWTDEDARLKTMLGVNAAMIFLKKGAPVGASHGIGHQLGPLGVGHGQTSCILLPSVMKWNAKANAPQQAKLKTAIWADPATAVVLKAHGLKEQESDVGDALDAIFRELGMPRTLKGMKIGRDRFDTLAENSLQDPCCASNPIPIDKKEQVLEILEMCAG